MSNQTSWKEDSNMTAYWPHPSLNQKIEKKADKVPVSIAEALQKKFRVETNSIVIPYVVRDHAWNWETDDNTHFDNYKEDAPAGYNDTVNYTLPHPTNIPFDNSTLNETCNCSCSVNATGNSTNATSCGVNATNGTSGNATNGTNGTTGTNGTSNGTITVPGHFNNGTTCSCHVNLTNTTNSTNATTTGSNATANLT